MLRQRNLRTHTFSICHAVVLAAFIVLAQVIGLTSDDKGLRYSGQDVVDPVSSAPWTCLRSDAGDLEDQSCGSVIKTKQDVPEAANQAVGRFGTHL